MFVDRGVKLNLRKKSEELRVFLKWSCTQMCKQATSPTFNYDIPLYKSFLPNSTMRILLLETILQEMAPKSDKLNTFVVFVLVVENKKATMEPAEPVNCFEHWAHLKTSIEIADQHKDR